ncbi:hypothetical protein O1L68_33735 [Streptomyces lydicus]|nr:hypothetical protein [Streptomyces lydicus]
MPIRQIPLYALAAGALAVSVLLFGDDGGADAAAEAVSRTVTGAAAEAGSAPDTANAVVVQPDPVTPGAAFSVSDGGQCSGDTAEATFDDTDIPALELADRSGQLGGTAILPANTAPGSYRVTLTCGGTSWPGRAPWTPAGLATRKAARCAAGGTPKAAAADAARSTGSRPATAGRPSPAP